MNKATTQAKNSKCTRQDFLETIQSIKTCQRVAGQETDKTGISGATTLNFTPSNEPVPKPAKRLRQNPYKIKGFWRSEECSRYSIARHNQFWRANEVLARQSLVLTKPI